MVLSSTALSDQLVYVWASPEIAGARISSVVDNGHTFDMSSPRHWYFPSRPRVVFGRIGCQMDEMAEEKIHSFPDPYTQF